MNKTVKDTTAKCAVSKKSCKTSKTEKCTNSRTDNPAVKTTGFEFPDFVGKEDREVLSAFSDADLKAVFDNCPPMIGSRAILQSAIKAQEEALPLVRTVVKGCLEALKYLPVATVVEIDNPPSNRKRLEPSKEFVDSLDEPITCLLSKVELFSKEDTAIVKNRILFACENLAQLGPEPVGLECGEALVVGAMMSLVHLYEFLRWRTGLLTASVVANKRARETVGTFASVLDDFVRDTEPKS